MISCVRARNRSLLHHMQQGRAGRTGGQAGGLLGVFPTSMTAKLICSEIKGDASDRATCKAGIMIYLCSTDGTMRSSFWCTPFIEPVCL